MSEPAVTVEIEKTQDDAEETRELAESLTTSLERQQELIEKVETCQTKLELLLNQSTAENPLISRIMTELTETRAELVTFRSQISELIESSNRLHTEYQNRPSPEPVAIVAAESTVEPVQPAPLEHPEPPQPEKPRRRIIKI